MKKIISFLLCAVMLTSCATTFEMNKPADICQRCKPAKDEPKRKIRIGYFIADIATGILMSAIGSNLNDAQITIGFSWAALMIDAESGKLYKPCEPEPEKKK